ncbi:HAD-IA family hydrolase [uncultured Hyphomicrobium sp.]|uniref:HAD-IA family hydrolase n=1 Tax=uncultured Hyphomicrobium sp. TaxID=194373 RepID=UPI0025D1D2A4|nr:HAD-IA family hydrolase [uncultured Hyphomicrobium sp.]
MTKLVIFDCDGTLVDSQHAIVAAMTDAFASEGLSPPPRERIVNVVGLSLAIAVARLVPEGSDLDRVDRLTESYKAAFAERRRQPGHSEPLYDGVRSTLQRLAARDDVQLAIATGKSRRGVNAVLERERLTELFVSIQTADTHPSKPHPSMILAAMDETAAAPADTVMIGDTVYDIEMAHAAGTPSIGVTWGYHPEAALRDAGAHDVTADCPALERALDRIIFRRPTA